MEILNEMDQTTGQEAKKDAYLANIVDYFESFGYIGMCIYMHNTGKIRQIRRIQLVATRLHKINRERRMGMDDGKKKLTTAAGAPVADNQNVLTAGPWGPQLLQDVWYLEKLAHFDREVIPERRMHAKGSGAYGVFTVTHDISKYTRAKIFSQVGKKTELFVRFSTVAGERGAADAERDIRGTAIKFYTEEGNWDLVGNNTPVFFLRDPLRFPGLNRAVKRDPRTNLRSAKNNWDFWTSLPEALQLLVDENLIKKSLVLPFRFLTAIEEIEKLNGKGVKKTLAALSKAVDISLSNVPTLDGKSLVVLDTSGSMTWGGRNIAPVQIGALFAAAMLKVNDSDFMTFDDDARYMSFNPADSATSIAQRIVEKARGGGTDFHSIFKTANLPYDRIIIFSDMQGWIGHTTPSEDFKVYKKKTNSNPFIYSFDLQGYGSLQFPERNVFALAGFSEKVFDIMKLLEADPQALLNEIAEIEL